MGSMPTDMRNSEARSRALLRDIEGALKVAGLDIESDLQLTPDFAGVTADVRNILTVPEVAQVTGVKERQVHHWVSGAHNPKGKARDRLLTLYQVISQLEVAMSEEQIKVWLFSVQPDLGGRPVDFIAGDSPEEVLNAARSFSMRSAIDDVYLIEIARSGNASAYDALVRRYRGFVRLKASSYFLLADIDSESLVQEGLLGLYKAIRDFPLGKESSFRSYAELCITRQLIAAVKTATRAQPMLVDPDTPSYSDPSTQHDTRSLGGVSEGPLSQVVASEALDQLVSSLSGAQGVLSELEGRVLSLYLDGYSYEAISKQLDCDSKTVDNALQRVKRKVSAHLAASERP